MFVEESGRHLRWFEPEKPSAPLEIALFFVATNRFKIQTGLNFKTRYPSQPVSPVLLQYLHGFCMRFT